VKIIYTPQAAADITEIYDYIQERHPSGAQKVKAAIFQSVGLLELFPYIGVRTDREGVRMLIVSRYPYLIFYTVIDEQKEIILLSIRHSARQR